MYKIPESVNINFDLKELPELTNRVYRIIWASISIGHIRDQYFRGQVAAATRDIKRHNPKSFEAFIDAIDHTGLFKYGRKGFEINREWWKQVWDLISKDGDIELVYIPN